MFTQSLHDVAKRCFAEAEEMDDSKTWDQQHAYTAVLNGSITLLGDHRCADYYAHGQSDATTGNPEGCWFCDWLDNRDGDV